MVRRRCPLHCEKIDVFARKYPFDWLAGWQGASTLKLPKHLTEHVVSQLPGKIKNDDLGVT